MPSKLKPINECRKPNGQLTSEGAYRLLQSRRGKLGAKARMAKPDFYSSFVQAGHRARRKLYLLGLIAKLSALGVECEHTRSVTRSLQT